MTKRQRRTNLIAILIGLVATAAVVAAYVGGALERLELITLDLRFRHTNSIPQSPDVVCIDIDDDTLEVVGRWPWPRDRQAPLVSILAELGARAILVDLTWTESEPFRGVPPEHVDIVADPLELDADDVEIGYPDLELRTAITGAGNVYLAYHPPGLRPENSAEFNAAVDALQDGDEVEAQRRLEQLLARRRAETGGDQDPEDQGLLRRARFVAMLEVRPTLGAEELAAELGLPRDGFAEKWFDRCRIAALERLTRRWFDAEPQRWRAVPHEVFRPHYEALSGRSFRGDTPLKRALAIAYHTVLGYEATTRKSLVPPEGIRAIATRVDGITPVYYLHARAARRCGFVFFEADADGVVRRMPLFAQHGGHTLAQIAFALACDELGVTPDGFVVEGRALKLRTPQGPRPTLTIQLDERGRALVPWVKGRAWHREQFTHIPADAIWSLHSYQRDLTHNRQLILEALLAVLSDERFAELAGCRRTLTNALKLEADVRESRYRGFEEEARLLEGHLNELRREIDEVERRVRARAETVQKDNERRGLAPDSVAPWPDSAVS
ncbi:MAG: CHASE2 domain-containing protein, partial [Phycisphaerae bacterium]